MEVELRQIEVPIQGQSNSIPIEAAPEITYTKERVKLLRIVKKLSIFSIIISIVQLVVSSIHYSRHDLDIILSTIIFGAALFIFSILILHWSKHSIKAYRASGELFQPRVNDPLTKTVYKASLLFAAISFAIGINLLADRTYSTDYARAQSTFFNTWHNTFNGLSPRTVVNFFNTSFVTLSFIQVLFTSYFLFVARASFKCLRWDNQTMTHTVFVASVLTLAFSLILVYFCYFVKGYDAYPALRINFPMWNIQYLFWLGIILAVLALVTFFVDHRSSRIGFLVLGYLLFFVLITMINFTIFAYHHSQKTYHYYTGIEPGATPESTMERLYAVDEKELEESGCPAKYISYIYCNSSDQVVRWEDYVKTSPSEDERSVNNTATVSGSQAAEMLLLEDGGSPVIEKYCLNENCVGINGQLYSRDFIRMANSGLFAILNGSIVLLGCAYFWYVNWIDAARDKKKDFLYLGAQLLVIISFVVFMIDVPMDLVRERVSPNGEHYY